MRHSFRYMIMAALFGAAAVSCDSSDDEPGGLSIPDSPELNFPLATAIMLNGEVRSLDNVIISTLEEERDRPKQNAVDLHISEPGELYNNHILDRLNDNTDSLTIWGTIDKSDISALRDFVTISKVRSINLKHATIKGNKLPEKAFYTLSTATNEPIISPLLRIILPDNLEEIEDGALAYTMIGSIELPKSLKKLGASSFCGDQLLGGTVVIPEGVEEIPYGCFMTGSLKDVSFSLPGTLRSIGDYAFANINIRHITIPGSTKVIGNNAFEGAIDGTLVIENGVERICEQAFWGCRFTSLTLPASVKYAAPYSFGILDKLKQIYCLSDNPAKTYDYSENSDNKEQAGAFSSDICDCLEMTHRDIPVYVPVGSAERYRKAKGWDWFTNFIETADMPAK